MELAARWRGIVGGRGRRLWFARSADFPGRARGALAQSVTRRAIRRRRGRPGNSPSRLARSRTGLARGPACALAAIAASSGRGSSLERNAFELQFLRATITELCQVAVDLRGERCVAGKRSPVASRFRAAISSGHRRSGTHARNALGGFGGNDIALADHDLAVEDQIRHGHPSVRAACATRRTRSCRENR